MSGQQFAKWAGIKYGTFITWVQKRRRKSGVTPAKDRPAAVGTKEEVRSVEAGLGCKSTQMTSWHKNVSV
jgi:hypothetical protein